jgi:hypothetical protein
LVVPVVLVLLAVVLSGCGPRVQPEGLTYSYREVAVYEEAPLFSVMSARAPGNGKGNRVEDFSYKIYQVAQLDPVVVNGTTVQANDIVISGDTAAIGYNTAGTTFAGAIQIVDIRNPVRPVITAELAFDGVDITTLELDGDTLYFGGSIDPDDTTYTTDRSFLAAIDLADLSSETLEIDTIDGATTFTSFYGGGGPFPYYGFTTGIAKNGGDIWVSVGADPGAVFLLNESLAVTEVVESEDPELDILDLRDIEVYHGGVIAIAGTYAPNTPPGPDSSRIMLIKSGGIDDKSTILLADDLEDDTKATIEVFDKRYAFIGQSNAGFQVVYLRDDAAGTESEAESIFELGNPTVGWSTRTATNSASYSGDLVFTANGEAGFRVFEATEKLRRDIPPGSDWLDLIGFVPFDETLQESGDYYSANHIEFRDDSLFVAAGLGGVLVYQLVAE